MALIYFRQGSSVGTNFLFLEYEYQNDFTYGVKIFISGTNVSYDSGAILPGAYVGDSIGVSGLSPGTSYTYTLTVRRNSNNAYIGERTITATTQALSPPSTPTGLFTSNISQTSITLNWSASSNTTNYTVFLNGSEVGTTTSTSYTFSGLVAGTSYSLSVRANGNGGSSSTATITGTTSPLPEYTYTINYNANGGSGSMSSTTITTTNTSATLTVASNQFTRSGFSFTSWNTSSSGGGTAYSPGNGITLTTGNSSITLFAQWQALPPGFTEQSITSRVAINVNVNTLPDNTVTASNVNQYSLISAGGTFPTWLSITNSGGTGVLSGSTNVAGTYTFRVRATNTSSGQFVDSNIITITAYYPGKRASDSSSFAGIESARRYDGSGWVNLTIMRRWNGSSWVNITN
jgi:chitodextrinase